MSFVFSFCQPAVQAASAIGGGFLAFPQEFVAPSVAEPVAQVISFILRAV
ncbi:MAG: hypothetical protein AB7Q01_08635 [Gammaproteobacteria bacterium]